MKYKNYKNHIVPFPMILHFYTKIQLAKRTILKQSKFSDMGKNYISPFILLSLITFISSEIAKGLEK